MSTDGHRTKWRRHIAENVNRLSMAHERYRRQMDDKQTTDDRRTGDKLYSEQEREFAFAKKTMTMLVATNNSVFLNVYYRIL